MKKRFTIGLIIEKFLPVDSFSRNATILSAGTLIGQGLIIIAAPILTRIYKPSDYGTLAVFVSILSILIVISSLKYQLSIPLPSEDRIAINLVVIALSIVVGITVLTGIALFFLSDMIILLVKMPNLKSYLWIIPLSLFAAGVYEVLHYWAIRKKYFNSLAYTKINQGIGTVTTQLGVGVYCQDPIGLIIGNAVGWLSCSLTLFLRLYKRDKILLKSISKTEIKRLIVRYIKFPLVSSFSGIVNTLGFEIVPLLLAVLYGPKTVGLFALTQRIIGIPIRLIGSSIAQVYTSEAVRLADSNPSRLEPYFFKQAKLLLLIGSFPLLIIGQLCPYLFGFIFGKDWTEAGRYAQILSITFSISFVVVPLSTTLNILEKQGTQFLWDIGRLSLVISAIFIFSRLGCSAFTMIKVYAVSMSCAYIILFYLLFRAVRQRCSKS